MTPNRLSARQVSAIHGPALTALIAFRLGRADSEHYHAVASALLIAQSIAESVPRHRANLPYILDALAALHGVFDRATSGESWTASSAEMDSMELGVEIARGLLLATPGPKVRRAIMAAMRGALGKSPMPYPLQGFTKRL